MNERIRAELRLIVFYTCPPTLCRLHLGAHSSAGHSAIAEGKEHPGKLRSSVPLVPSVSPCPKASSSLTIDRCVGSSNISARSTWRVATPCMASMPHTALMARLRMGLRPSCVATL